MSRGRQGFSAMKATAAPAPGTLGPVLAATDLSAPSRDAVERAARVATATASQLSVVHASGGGAMEDLRQWLGLTPAPALRLQAQARQELEALTQSIGQRHGLAANPILVDAAPVAGILEAADRLGAGLLVVGASGANALRRMALGATSERLLQRSSRPVLVVKQAAREDYRRVLVPVDFSKASAAIIHTARAVAPQAHLVLMHAWTVPYEGKLLLAGVDSDTIEHYRHRSEQDAGLALRELAAEAGLDPARWTACIVPGDAAPSIVQQEKANDCDLVALGKQGRHAVESLLLGSVTRRVLAESSADNLVVQPQPAA
jgi:nucleotide-binding universal stress UspA family protein